MKNWLKVNSEMKSLIIRRKFTLPVFEKKETVARWTRVHKVNSGMKNKNRIVIRRKFAVSTFEEKGNSGKIDESSQSKKWSESVKSVACLALSPQELHRACPCPP